MVNALVPAREAQNNLKKLLDAPNMKAALAAVLPRHLTPERMCKIALAATSRQPELLVCTADSIIKTILVAAELGLEPNTPLGLSYIVPFRDKTSGRTEATLIPGYKGLIRLGYQSGELEFWRAIVIHEKDEWKLRLGDRPRLHHIPYSGGEDPGVPVGFYSLVKFKGKDGGYDFEFMTTPEIERIRRMSKAANSPAWTGSYEEMGKKTVMRRHAKRLPLSSDRLAKALELQAASEDGSMPDFSAIIELPPEDYKVSDAPAEAQPVKESTKGAAGLKADLAKKAAASAKPLTPDEEEEEAEEDAAMLGGLKFADKPAAVDVAGKLAAEKKPAATGFSPAA